MLGRENEYINEYFGGQYGPGFAWAASNVPVFSGIDTSPNYEVADTVEASASGLQPSPYVQPVRLPVITTELQQPQQPAKASSWIGPVLLVTVAIAILK